MPGTWVEYGNLAIWVVIAWAFAFSVRGLWAGGYEVRVWPLAALTALAALASIWGMSFVIAVALGFATGLSLLGQLSRWAAPGRALFLLSPFVSHSRFRASLLLLVCPVLALGWGYHDQAGSPQVIDPREEVPVSQRLVPAAHAYALTDRGRRVNLYWAADANSYLVSMQQEEAKQAQERALRLLRTAPPDETSNCHGWVFADGAFWILPADAEHVLQDNGYVPVTDPRVDDLLVYRNDEGVIEHTGVVRAAAEGGLVLIESKWGQQGRYIHRPEDSPYGTRYTYYHSRRASHRLELRTGTPPAEPEQPVAVPIEEHDGGE